MVRTIVLQGKRIPKLDKLLVTHMGDFLDAALFPEDITEKEEMQIKDLIAQRRLQASRWSVSEMSQDIEAAEPPGFP